MSACPFILEMPKLLNPLRRDGAKLLRGRRLRWDRLIEHIFHILRHGLVFACRRELDAPAQVRADVYYQPCALGGGAIPPRRYAPCRSPYLPLILLS